MARRFEVGICRVAGFSSMYRALGSRVISMQDASSAAMA
jgi:hypothetical protein